ncbi:MAG: YhbY family RNA-binding protein [Methanomassiliicoccaceae archaeon]|jgi:RNA-binding protein|nr:YhbY family RNA-binding protein [Methanomassiliicoccaceae archaeon]
MTEKEAKKEIMRRANDIVVTLHVGKDGLKESVFEELRLQIKTHRIVKVKVLPSSESETADIADALSQATDSVIVDVRGNVLILTDKRTWTSLSQKKF